jgi:hypothetical protein
VLYIYIYIEGPHKKINRIIQESLAYYFDIGREHISSQGLTYRNGLEIILGKLNCLSLKTYLPGIKIKG